MNYTISIPYYNEKIWFFRQLCTFIQFYSKLIIAIINKILDKHSKTISDKDEVKDKNNSKDINTVLEFTIKHQHQYLKTFRYFF